MTPENKTHLEWLNDMNSHLADGGKLEWSDVPGDWTVTTVGPNWCSEPDEWRKVPLPRKAVIRVAYKWTGEGEVMAYVLKPEADSPTDYNIIEMLVKQTELT